MKKTLAQHLGLQSLSFREVKQSEFVHCCIDVQREFCDPSHRAKRGNERTVAISRHIGSVAPAFRAAHIPTFMVYFARDKAAPADVAGGGFFNVKPAKGDVLIPKDRDSAFEGSDIEHHLKTRGIKTLVVTGFNTNACVYKTVMDGLRSKFNVWLLTDCIGNDNCNGEGYKEQYIDEMRDSGAQLKTHTQALEEINQAVNANAMAAPVEHMEAVNARMAP